MSLPWFLDPKFWLGLVIWTAMVVFGAYVSGSSDAKDKAAVSEAKRTSAALAGLAKADAKELADERKLRAADRTAFDTFTKENDSAKAETDRVIAGLHRDVIRLRVPIRAPRATPKDASGPVAAPTGEEGHAELTGDASAFVVGLLARGDEGIRKHAEVVDRYERLRIACTTDDLPTHQGQTP